MLHSVQNDNDKTLQGFKKQDWRKAKVLGGHWSLFSNRLSFSFSTEYCNWEKIYSWKCFVYFKWIFNWTFSISKNIQINIILKKNHNPWIFDGCADFIHQVAVRIKLVFSLNIFIIQVNKYSYDEPTMKQGSEFQ